MQEHDVVGIGNAIVDIIGRCDDAFLARARLPEGQHAPASMQRASPTSTRAWGRRSRSPAARPPTRSSASPRSAARPAFIGKVADDEFGRIFAHDIRAAGVASTRRAAKGGAPTARSLILVTPDGERTMNTFLGVSPELDDGELDADMIAPAGIVYLEGYLFDRPEAKAAFREAAAIAAKAGRAGRADAVGRLLRRPPPRRVPALIKDQVDILFANESEITSLYQTTSFDEAARRPPPTSSSPC